LALCFGLQVGGLEGFAEQVGELGHHARIEQRPFLVRLDTLHEQVRIQLARFRLCARRDSSPVLSRSSRKSSMSACQVSRYTQAAPLRLPPWFTAATDESMVFS